MQANIHATGIGVYFLSAATAEQRVSFPLGTGYTVLRCFTFEKTLGCSKKTIAIRESPTSAAS